LSGNVSSLNEVVVIGYGTRLKKDLTGSVTAITAKDFNKGAITTPEQLIAGKVAGVQIISNGGAPGSGSTIRIRGGASLNASNEPLIVIDGVPIAPNRNPDGTPSIAGSPDPLSLINPNDIESFNILKDASAAAIYGSRASNGVIIITTKKGRTGKPKFIFSTQNSLSTLPKKADILSPDEFRTYVNSHGTPSQIALLGNANTDWQDEIYDGAFSTDNNLSVSGSLKNYLPYRVSLGYLNQDGILRTGNLQRTSAALTVNPVLFDNHLKIDLNLKGSLTSSRFADEGAIGNAVRFDPTQPVTSKSNRFGGYYEWLDASSKTGLRALAPRNPIGLLEQRTDKSDVNRSIGNIQFDYKLHFFPDLRVNVNLGYDVSKGEGTIYVPDSAASSYMRSPDGKHGGVNNSYLQKKSNTLFESYLNYVKEVKSINSRIDVTMGYSYQKFRTSVYNAKRDPKGPLYQKSDGSLDTIPTSGDRWSPYSDRTRDGFLISSPKFPDDYPENRLISLFARLNYSFKGKYLLTGTIRRDASSRFMEDTWIGWFPSGAFAWRISEEEFMKNSTVISDLKLRLGYGETGQQEGIGNYDYLSRYSLSNGQAQYQFGNTFYDLYRPAGYNDNLKWEQTTTYNIGLDYGILDNRIFGTVDFYLKKTSDLLSVIDQSAGSNFSNKSLANIGTMENRGVEFTISAQVIRNKEINWDLGFNVTYNKNEITKLTFTNDPNFPGNLVGGIAGGVGSTIQIHSVGYPKSSFYVYQQIYGKDGKPIEDLFEDRNRDGLINNDDLYRYKSPDPDVFLGAYSNVSWKNWNAGFSLRASFGNYMYNNRFSNTGVQRNIIDPLNYLANGSRNVLETNFTGNGDKYFFSDYYVENASFLRMDNINVGYNAGALITKNTNLRIGASVQNVFTITKYEGLDPEVSSGIDNNFYPRPRIFTLNLNLDF
ncbi:MAG TPA: SusC/RagA family TonB-linked outer membrane protein, partial [Chitinophagaceae bacterium]|nr:SusC/RagA family TonB-linked outer membrane protein [Chitinophagaceae bacterium]